MTELDHIDREEVALTAFQSALISFLTYIPEHDVFRKECQELFVKTSNRLEALKEYRERVISSAESSAGM